MERDKSEVKELLDKAEIKVQLQFMQKTIDSIEAGTSWISFLLTLTFTVITNVLFWPWFVDFIKSQVQQ